MVIKIQKTNPTADMLKDYMKANQINFDLPMQRGYVWTREKKSKLILSMLEGYPIPPLYANFKNKVYHIVDEQQRGKTIIEFQQNKFVLGALPPVTIEGKEYDVSGKKFEDLFDELQTIIRQFNLDLQYAENMTDDEQKEMFIRLNSGKPLSTTEMTKAQIKSVSEITALAQHNVFKKIINEKGIEASKNTSLVMQTFVALFEPNKCMLGSAIKKTLGATQISNEQKDHIIQCLDVFEQVYESFSHDPSSLSKKLTLIFKRKSHFISFVYTISQAIQSEHFDIKILIDWCEHFFDCEVDQTTISNAYNLCLKESMNSHESVTSRLQSMFSDYLRYVDERNETV